MIKLIRQAKNFLKATRYPVNKDLKNLKISPDVHKKLKVQAAEYGLQISEYADVLLTLAMSEQKIWAERRAAMLATMLEKKQR